MKDPLFEPININQMEVKNRIYLPAMHLAMCVDFQVTDQIVEFYARRARGGAGPICVGFATIDDMAGNSQNIGAHKDEYLPGLTRLASGIKENGACAAIQLNHSGRYNFSFFHTPQVGLYRVSPKTLERVSAFEAGSALAAEVATATAEAFLKDNELRPRVNPELCRGCGRCAEICPFDAIKMVPSSQGIFTAEVVRHNCVGCGGCVGRCPVTAMDIPYFSNQLLTEILVNTLAGEDWDETV